MVCGQASTAIVIVKDCEVLFLNGVYPAFAWQESTQHSSKLLPLNSTTSTHPQLAGTVLFLLATMQTQQYWPANPLFITPNFVPCCILTMSPHPNQVTFPL